MVEFGSVTGFIAFLSVLALIIIYLIRPRPKDMTMPSLMFIIRDSGKPVKSSFLEKLLRNLVFLLQLIALSGLAFALTQPIFNISYDAASSNTVIVLDASASMSADDNARFKEAVSTAKGSMKGDVSIVLAQEFPVLLLDNGRRGKAGSILSGLKPKDTKTNLGDAMLLAKDLLEGEEGRVLVLSDFIYTTGPDPDVVRKILEADGAVVDFVNVGSKGDNIGITDLLINKYYTEVYIRNFNEEPAAVTAAVINNNKEIKKVKMEIAEDSVSSFSFETPGGRTEIKLDRKDDLMADNTAYVSAPEKTKIKALLISNEINIYLKKALESSKEISLDIANPPILPDIGDYDIIILGNYYHDKLLTGTLEGIDEQVRNGKSAVIMARTDMAEVDYKGLLPVRPKERVDKSPTSVSLYSQPMEGKHDFAEEEDIEFGTSNQYFKAEALNGSVIYAEAADSSPMIVSMKRGSGSIIYYGIIDRFSTFKSSPSYPVFWNELFNALVGTEDISSFNYPTGKIMSLAPDTRIRTPSGTRTTSRLLLDRAGFYTFNRGTIAANLLDETESDISAETDFTTESRSTYTAREVERRRDVNISAYLIIAALAAILAELFIVKYRGDL